MTHCARSSSRGPAFGRHAHRASGARAESAPSRSSWAADPATRDVRAAADALRLIAAGWLPHHEREVVPRLHSLVLFGRATFIEMGFALSSFGSTLRPTARSSVRRLFPTRRRPAMAPERGPVPSALPVRPRACSRSMTRGSERPACSLAERKVDSVRVERVVAQGDDLNPPLSRDGEAFRGMAAPAYRTMRPLPLMELMQKSIQ